MKHRILIALLLSCLVAGGLFGPAGVAAKGKKAKAFVVGKDAEGDWGQDNASGEDISMLGQELGMDIVEASISMADKETINFVIKVSGLPPAGGWPEIPRYIWGLTIDGDFAELDGKFTNYSRGACDPTSTQCPPPRDPGQQPFLVRGECTTDATANLTTCKELGVVQATFDTAAGTITIPVPMDMLGAKPGTKIAGGTSDFSSQAGGAVLAIASAFVSRSDFPRDAMQVTKTFTVP
ncbi:MAG: hypothetical protein ACRDG9_05365, partial [Actinomycetota bacterium]